MKRSFDARLAEELIDQGRRYRDADLREVDLARHAPGAVSWPCKIGSLAMPDVHESDNVDKAAFEALVRAAVARNKSMGRRR